MIVFDVMIPNIMTNNKLQVMTKELFSRCRKLNISLVYITRFYFPLPKKVRISSTYCLILKIYNRKELRNISTNHLADIDYKDFMEIYKKCTSDHILL